MSGFLAFLLTLAGASCLYLATRHQAWRAARLPPRAAVPVGVVLLILGLGGWMRAAQPVTGIFVFLTLLMLLWSLFPFVGVINMRGRQ